MAELRAAFARVFRPYLLVPGGKGEPDKVVRGGAFAGPITGPKRKEVDPDLYGDDVEYDASFVETWKPHMALAPFGDLADKRPLTAAAIETRRAASASYVPVYFANPLQHLDYLVIEGLTKTTFVGALMDAFVRFVVGTGFRPELELINPDAEDDEKNASELEQGQEIIDRLLEIDRQVDEGAEGEDIPLAEKVAMMISQTLIYNRSALVFGYDRPVEVDGQERPGIPSTVRVAHPKDLGMIEVDPATWRLKGVHWHNGAGLVKSKDMAYLWNPLVSGKYHNAMFYGGSVMLTMLDPARVIRKLVAVDFLAMAEATWAGIYNLVIKPEGQTEDDKRAEYQRIVDKMARGGPNILLADPQHVGFHTANFSPKVNEFRDLYESLIRLCVANLGLPQTMFFDESQSNRATMIGKIQLATSTVINPMREQIGRQICSQWYGRWFRMLYKGQPELEKFRIRLAWSDLRVAEWFDMVAAVNELDGRKTLKDREYGELVGVQNYASKIDEEQQRLKDDIMKADAVPPSPSRPKPKAGRKDKTWSREFNG